MTKKALLIPGLLCILVILAGMYLYLRKADAPAPVLNTQSEDAYINHDDPSTGISFSYPHAWGSVEKMAGNKLCPEEDTYRTPDTLPIYDYEFRFENKALPGSDSIIRSGIRVYGLDPGKPLGCVNELLQKLATRETTGTELSSVRLTEADIPGFFGTWNEDASRLDTEGRLQYTLFREENGDILVFQPYMSFIPFSGSPEWQEIDTLYRNNMSGYLSSGRTAEPVRLFIAQFKKVAASLAYDSQE